jgi:hypothetical protein
VRTTVKETSYTPLNDALGQVIMLNMQGDEAATLRLGLRQIEQTNDRLWRQLIIGTALTLGDLPTARGHLQQLEPAILQPAPDITDVPVDTALYALNLLIREGDAAGATHVARQLLELHAAPAGGYDPVAEKLVRAKVLAQLGNTDAAMAELHAAQLQGYRMLWDFDNFQRLDRLPWFDGLRSDARFKAFIDAIDTDNRTSREQLRAD